ncbi:ABC transporter substrate-binding protein [Corynebacterium sp.]|uniref:ABC transporter substrate-binding protein n=1 Tax=Corynebacterium sp. TaxID=1720 RepID=UPI00264899E1|nr:ABC transporter substrate-binding protein [Corynebacterium sp.]MDN6136239.1 ABC transporter substrate-binding protein [Corynebacterium sp.]MDN6736647.1 ABC transporter substrate-binding protein [Corynebacterium sp.]
MKILSFVPYCICLIIPLRGPGGIFGPSCMAVSELAKEELNVSVGIGGRPVEFVYVDGGAPADEVVAEVLQLAQAGENDAITSWHISSIRKKLGPLLKGKIPLKVTCEGLRS